MDEVLRRALEPVLRDLRESGLDTPRIEDWDWTDDPDRPSAMLWSPDAGLGISVLRSATPSQRIAAAADQAQEWAIEGQLWGAGATNWPRCPRHPSTHPMQATTVKDSAVWVCPLSEEVVAPIGDL